MSDYKVKQVVFGAGAPLNLDFRISQLIGNAGQGVSGKINVYTDAAKDRLLEELSADFKLPDKQQPSEVVFAGPLGNYDDDLITIRSTAFSGKKFIDHVVIEKGLYKCFDRTGNVVKREFPEITFPAITIIELNYPVEISRALPNSGYGSVKQDWAVNDWEVNFTSLLLSKRGAIDQDGQSAYPSEEYKSLLQLRLIRDSVRVYSKLLNDAGIHYLVFRDGEFRQKQGRPGSLEFNISAWSDTPYEIEFELKTKKR
jgi:hypothetical protein